MASLEINVTSKNDDSNWMLLESDKLKKAIDTPIKKLKELEIDTKGNYLENLKLGKSKKTVDDIAESLGKAFAKINATGKLPSFNPYQSGQVNVNVAPPSGGPPGGSPPITPNNNPPGGSPPIPPSPPSPPGGSPPGGGGYGGNNPPGGQPPIPPNPPPPPGNRPPIQPPPPPIIPPPIQPPPPPGGPGGPGGPGQVSQYASAMSFGTLATQVLQVFLDLRNAIYIPIKEAFTVLAKSSTKEGIKASELISISGSGLQRSVTSATTGMGTVGGAGVGAVLGTTVFPGVGTLAGAALGSTFGRTIGREAGELTGIGPASEIVSLLFQIAQNTASNAMAFSPELIGVKLDHQLKTLEMNMRIADRYGSDLADLQESANEVQRQLYEVAVDILIQFKPILESILAAIKFLIPILQGSGAVLNELAKLMGGIAIGVSAWSPVLGLFLKDASNAIQKWLNSGKKTAKRIKSDPDKDFIKNRPTALTNGRSFEGFADQNKP
jgi:hypothetical protein